jgi:hypothetical protein
MENDRLGFVADVYLQMVSTKHSESVQNTTDHSPASFPHPSFVCCNTLARATQSMLGRRGKYSRARTFAGRMQDKCSILFEKQEGRRNQICGECTESATRPLRVTASDSPGKPCPCE